MRMKKIISLLFLITGYFYLPAQQAPRGVDVSHHQGTIDWSLVYADGYTFAFVKATEGFTYNDPNFVSNMVNGNNAGLLMGAYHFARPDNNSAADEARHFVQMAGNYIGNGWLPPVLDLEDPPGGRLDQIYTSAQLTQWVQTWLDTVQARTGVEPIIYTNGHYANYLQASLNRYRLWMADPDGSPTTPPNNLGHWTTWAFKQYYWYGNVNGISGDVDLDVFNGTLTELQNMASGGGGGGGSANLDCSNAQTVSCGDFYHGASSTAASQVDSYGCNGWTETGPERVHAFTPSSSGHLSVIISGFQGDLDVYILNSCNEADCSGQVYSSSAVLDNIQAGHTYYIVVDADDGSGSAYDLYVACANQSNPDDISLNNARLTSSAQINAGGTVDVYVKQYYSGASTNIPDVKVSYYLSNDCQLDSGDILLGSDLSSINANHRTETETHTLTIPAGTSDGNYYILFHADDENMVSEVTDLNNTVCVPVTVGQVDVEKFRLKSLISIYPNPTNGIIFYKVKENHAIISAGVYDISGKKLMFFERPTGKIDISSLPAGLYLLQFRDDKNYTAVFRIIKQ